MWFLRDTKYCLLNILADIVSNLSAIGGVFLLAEQFGNIGGLTRAEIMFMLGYACLVDGVILMCFSMNNVAWISRPIGRGQLDHKLIQPVPLWMQLLTEGFIPVSGSSTLLCGLFIKTCAYRGLLVSSGMSGTVALALSILGSVAVILSFSYIISCLAFYAPVAGEEVSTTAIGLFGALKSFPLGGLTITARIVLCTFLPVGLAAWLPSTLLLGAGSAGLSALLMVLVTIALSLTATTMFKKGLKHYAKYGSIRYMERGHRR